LRNGCSESPHPNVRDGKDGRFLGYDRAVKDMGTGAFDAAATFREVAVTLTTI
jgi:hypothetical protein